MAIRVNRDPDYEKLHRQYVLGGLGMMAYTAFMLQNEPLLRAAGVDEMKIENMAMAWVRKEVRELRDLFGWCDDVQ